MSPSKRRVALLGGVEQHLHAQADTEQRLGAALQRFDEPGLIQPFHRKARRTYAGENQAVGLLDRRRVAH